MNIQDGIIIGDYVKGFRLTLDMAREMLIKRLALQNGKSYPLLLHVNGLVITSKEVRVFMTQEGLVGILCVAMVVKRSYEQLLINMFFSVDAPKVPTKVFVNEADAILWIKQETVKSNSKI